MARDGVITRSFGRINARYQTPWNSLHLIFILTFIFVLLPSAIFGIYFTYMWWGKAVVFFAIVIYIFVSIANPLFYYRFKRNDFSFFWNGVMGFISLIVNLYLLFKAFLVDSWRNDWLNGKSVVVFAVLWMITGFMYVFYLRRRNPDLFFKKPIYFDTNNSK
jgi:amino acid transporter